MKAALFSTIIFFPIVSMSQTFFDIDSLKVVDSRILTAVYETIKEYKPKGMSAGDIVNISISELPVETTSNFGLDLNRYFRLSVGIDHPLDYCHPNKLASFFYFGYFRYGPNPVIVLYKKGVDIPPFFSKTEGEKLELEEITDWNHPKLKNYVRKDPTLKKKSIVYKNLLYTAHCAEMYFIISADKFYMEDFKAGSRILIPFQPATLNKCITGISQLLCLQVLTPCLLAKKNVNKVEK